MLILKSCQTYKNGWSSIQSGFITLITLSMLRIQNSQARQRKRRKLQQSVKTMFQRTGPKFVETIGVQLVCRYCNRKFKAPQGLSAHIKLHERAGDFLCRHEEK